MSDHELGELFAVLRGLGLENRAEPPIKRVPEKQATIWFDVKTTYAKPTWKALAFVFGLTHTYPMGVAINAGIWKAQVGPWFDAWIARAKAAPLTMLAERRSDGSGVIVWREKPTRASLFARLEELNASEEKWRAAAGAQPAGPAQVIAGMSDPAQAWQALARAALIPGTWAAEPRRRFHHSDDRWETFPRTVQDCASIAEQLPAMARYEALAFDLFARTWSWQLGPGGQVAQLAPSVARWVVLGPMKPGSMPMVPCLLRGLWDALAVAVADAGMPAYTDVSPMPGWADRAAWAWAAALSRGLRVPANPWVPAPLVGRAFGEMGAPLAAAKEIEAMPYRVTGVDAYSLTLGAWSRSA